MMRLGISRGYRCWFIVFLVLWDITICQDLGGHRRDPTPIIYPGQVNIAYLGNIHNKPNSNSSNSCGSLRQDAVQKAMASVWAAHQANFRKEDSQELNIGVYIFDTCGREDIAERQVYRLLGHVGHVQTTTCSEKRIPPLFAVVTEGDSESLKIPAKLLHAFGVPIISTSTAPELMEENVLSTAVSAGALARAAVTVLRHLRLLEVAVIAEEEDPQSRIFEEFAKEAKSTGMQALPVDHPSIVGDPENFLASLQVVSEYGKSHLKAVVFLVSPEQALDLLQSVDNSNMPQMPWVLVTQQDLSPDLVSTFKRHQLRRLQKVFLLSAENSPVPEFQEYFKELLNEDTIKYHPLLVEFAESVTKEQSKGSQLKYATRMSSSEEISKNSSTYFINKYKETDVSSVVKAIWTLAASLKTVQKKSCRRGTDCLLYLRRSLSSYVLKAATTIDYELDSTIGTSSLQGAKLSFGKDGTLSSVRYSLKGFTARGDIQEVGWYSDETGLAIDREVFSTLEDLTSTADSTTTTGITSTTEASVSSVEKTSTRPTTSSISTNTSSSTTGEPRSVYRFQAEKSSRTTTGLTATTEAASVLRRSPQHKMPLEDDDYLRWKILDEASFTREFSTTSRPFSGTFDDDGVTESDIAILKSIESNSHVVDNHVSSTDLNAHKMSVLSNMSKSSDANDYELHLGPTYTNEQQSSSNLRSISLTSHHEPRVNKEYWPSKVDMQPVQATVDNPTLARSIDTSSAEAAAPNPFEEDVKMTPSRKNLHISAWLSRPWALTILGLCGFGMLITMYILVFIMVKSCEGTLKKTNTSIAVAQLLAVLALYFSAALYTWKPSELLCNLERLVPNVSYAFCFGCLLLKGMHLRAQNSLGLGGSVNRFNQILTLFFIVGVQVALEIQWWFLRPASMSFKTLECSTTKEEIMESQGYISFLLLISVIVSISTRKIPYNQQEGRSLIGTSLTCLIVFLAWDVACWLLPDFNSRNIASPSGLIVTAIVILSGIFGPQLFAIHKYGGFPHKPLSYADSLSTVFTMFKDLDNASNNGTTGRGKKSAKTVETPFGNEIGEGTRNPLYSDYQSAYP